MLVLIYKNNLDHLLMLYLIHKKEAFFVVREKHKMILKVVNDKSYNNPATGVMADQTIMFTAIKPKETIRMH